MNGGRVVPCMRMLRGLRGHMRTGGAERFERRSTHLFSGAGHCDGVDFEVSAATHGRAKREMQIAKPALTTMRQTDLTWAVNGLGRPYIQAQQTQIDPGQTYAKTMRSEQTVDVRGNLIQSKLSDFGNA